MTTIIAIIVAWTIIGSFLSKFVFLPYFIKKFNACTIINPKRLHYGDMIDVHARGAIIANAICWIAFIPVAFYRGFMRGFRKPKPQHLPRR